ncbi:MAG: FeoB small GTPase domain-containing protein, partial [Candidatus Heimdallarchaeaceae archaeon]
MSGDCHSSQRRFKFRQREKYKHKRKFTHFKSKHKRKPFNDHSIEHQIAFLGNPNVGKSSLFNLLTGSHQHIGNWAGKTVERKEGHFILNDEFFEVIDLPGTY